MLASGVGFCVGMPVGLLKSGPAFRVPINND